MRIGKQVVATGDKYRLYSVSQKNGRWLWLVSEDVKGWAQADEVIPIRQAVNYYSEVVKAKPNQPNAYFFRAIVWGLQGELDKAVADFGEVIRLDPKLPMAFKNRGNCWHLLADFDRAIADYTEAIRLGSSEFCVPPSTRLWIR